MNLVAQAKERLPCPVRATLRPVYQKVRGVWDPAFVLDEELVRDIMEYFNLSYSEATCMCKLGRKLNIRFWYSLHPETDEEIERFYEITPFYVFELAYWHMDRRQRKFRDEVLKISSGDVLDYGGGIGDLCVKLAEKELNVTYGDVPGVTFEFAKWLFKRRGYNIEVIALGKGALSKRYDTILCTDVIIQTPHPGAILQRVVSSLKKNGKLIITCLQGARSEYPLYLETGVDVKEQLNSLGLLKTDKDWLWVKADATVPVEQELARQHRIGVK